MTREEAIVILMNSNEYHHAKGDLPHSTLTVKAFNMAIDALEEMSVEEYRQRLFEVFHKTDHDELITYVVMPKDEEFKSLEYILRQYKFEPKRPHGEWLSHYEYCKKHDCLPSGLIAFWWCNQCEQGVEIPTNFCPNCGADMRKEGETD